MRSLNPLFSLNSCLSLSVKYSIRVIYTLPISFADRIKNEDGKLIGVNYSVRMFSFLGPGQQNNERGKEDYRKVG